MHKYFLKLYYFFRRQKTLGFLLLGLFIFGGSYFASKINLEEDITKLVPSGEKQQVLQQVLDHTDFSDKLIIAVSSESKNPDELTAYADKLTDSLNEKLPEYIDKIQGRVPEAGILEVYDFVYENLPLFLNSKDYCEISNRLENDSIKKRVEKAYNDLMSPTGFVTKHFIFKDPLGINNIGLKKLRELQVEKGFKIYNDYLLTSDEKHVLLFISPKYPASETNQNEAFIDGLDHIITTLNKDSQVKGDYFGGVLYALANAKQIKKDIQLTLSIAFSILLVLLIVYYRKFYIPLLLFLPSIFGALSAISLLYFFKGSVSAISLGIGAVLLGISLDYALHILTHFRHNSNVEILYRDVTRPILMSSCTTAIAFLCLLFVESEALNDLGVFAAVSVLTASFFSLLLIPHFYKPKPKKTKAGTNWLDRIAAIRYYKNKVLLGLVGLLFIVGLFLFNSVGFNKDLSQLNYKPNKIQESENEILNIAGRAANTTYLVSYGNDIEKALLENNELYEKLQKFKNQGKIENFSSIGGVVLSTDKQLEKIESWDSFWSNAKINSTRQALIRESAELGFKPASFNRFYNQLNKDFNTILLDDYRQVKSLYLDDFIDRSPGFSTVTSTVSLENPDPEVIANLETQDGVIAIDRKQMNENFLGSLKEKFNTLIIFSVIAVFIVLLLFYRSLILSLLTLLPIAVTWIITLGVMLVLNIEFNILNIIISTFIFGLGLDYSIFITNASLKEYETGKKVLPTYQASILLSVITTLLGVGSLIFAKHPALQSVSTVSVIGILTAVMVSFVWQTKLFQVLFIKRKARQKPAFSFSGLLAKKGSKEKLYMQQTVLGNYRFKNFYVEVRRDFLQHRERFLKISGFITEGEQVFMLNNNFGSFPVFLSKKNPEANFFVFEADTINLEKANNTPTANAKNINFSSVLPEDFKGFSVFIINRKPEAEVEKILKEVIPHHAQKVIILSSALATRWLLDLNFKITYRQSNILVFEKAD
ncbi:hypothetical protein SAMN05444483_103353 [Salegentibacter echinorum]|uniref:Membrane transport protein MMPL domain-containing protein n=1 Tax=Salegentibacter echinorum TaxID=1073325 RepID=A0A1M5FU92_SALEC|nr:MMPL family transporter [Salegentibacter echinorum]SHF94999.1 hypothetical protein SAMN05444483_103353 [Salegentibacter echinorum]